MNTCVLNHFTNGCELPHNKLLILLIWPGRSFEKNRLGARSCVCHYFSRPRPWHELLLLRIWTKLDWRDDLCVNMDNMTASCMTCIWDIRLLYDLHLISKASCHWLSTDLSPHLPPLPPCLITTHGLSCLLLNAESKLNYCRSMRF